MTPLEQIADIVGEAQVRNGTAEDAIDGMTPSHVAFPETVEQVSEVMTVAQSNRWHVAPRGGATGLGLGNPPEKVDLVIDLSRMNRVIEHSSGDLVAAMEAGARIDDVQTQLATTGQMLALDGYAPGATIGGLVATNTSGPRRFRYGTVRDLLIGVTIVLPDGTVAKAGGKVVKNVAGYDLSKLMTGSLGTLGIIARAIFRLHPKPRSQRLVVTEVNTPAAVTSLVQRTLHSGLVPTAVQLSWPAGGPGKVGVLFESIEASVVAQAVSARTLYAGDGSVHVHDQTDIANAWRVFEEGQQASAGGLEIKMTCLSTALGQVIETAQRAAGAHGGNWRLSGEIGTGIVRLHIDETDAGRAATLVNALRTAIRPGHVTVLRAPVEVKRQVDVWGPLGDTEPLMRRVKFRFDPENILNPGRFVGGI